MRWLSIIGIGEDGAAGLSPVARGLVEHAWLVVGGARHLRLAACLINCRSRAWSSPLQETFPEIVACRGRPVVVLATGDPFHYGVGRQLAQIVPADEMMCLPQPSAFSLAAARLGWALEDTALVTLHGRALGDIVPHLHSGARLLALSWNGTTPGAVANLLASKGMSGSGMFVLEALGGPHERIRRTTAGSFDLADIAALNTIAVEVVAARDAGIIPLAPGLDDALFESDGQLTRREVRAVTLSALAPRRAELLWDVGLGAGSVAIEWLLSHPSLRAIGIERQADRVARARRNAAALGATRLEIVEGEAPAAFAGLMSPDAVFLGGGASRDEVFEAAWLALRPGGRMVANAVTLEAEAKLIERYGRLGGELIRVQVARADRVGSLHGWRPAMPVTQWRAVKP